MLTKGKHFVFMKERRVCVYMPTQFVFMKESLVYVYMPTSGNNVVLKRCITKVVVVGKAYRLCWKYPKT